MKAQCQNGRRGRVKCCSTKKKSGSEKGGLAREGGGGVKLGNVTVPKAKRGGERGVSTKNMAEIATKKN